MVTLYETLHQDNTFSNPTYLQENKHGDKYITTKTNIGCVQPSYLNGHTQFKDWTGVSGKGITKEQMIGYIHKSIQGGDPIVIFTSKGFAFSRSIHILCLVGYDDTTQTVIVNDPNVNQVNEYTNKNREGQLLTYDLLFNHHASFTTTQWKSCRRALDSHERSQCLHLILRYIFMKPYAPLIGA
jgi:hypothetical protein